MPKYRKVDAASVEEQTKEIQESQKKYNEKVRILKTCCINFVKSFLEDEKEFNKVEAYHGNPSNWQKKFKDAFKGPMKANKLTSRTSKILQQMSKNLGKFKNEKEFDIDKMEEYKDAFSFEEEKAKFNKKKGENLIKRSAIDNPVIVEFFKGKNKNTKAVNNISDLLVKMKEGTIMKSNNYTVGVNMAEQLKKLKSTRR